MTLSPFLRIATLSFVLVGTAGMAAQEAQPDEKSKDESAAVWTLAAGEGKYKIEIDTSETPDLTEWARGELSPVLAEWYPKIVVLLPSDRFSAPTELSVTFRDDDRGVAATSGTRIRCSAGWFRKNLEGEAKGAVVHELVHVVQQYGAGRRRNSDARRPPGWLVEGIADQIRWFLYEPESRGAEISRRGLARARHDSGYRVSANFLDWAARTHDKELIRKLNAALRSGTYSDEIWKELCGGRTLEELDAEWKKGLEALLAAAPDAPAAPASAEETKSVAPAAGSDAESAASDAKAGDAKAGEWKSLFDGKSLEGWHSFGQNVVRPGWQVKDGTLVCADPHDAGDLCTNDRYEWFELELEYRIAEGGNSGIMFHVTDEGRTAWATGPEFQLEDNAKAADPVRCGWLYALYQPPDDPKTGKPLDSTKPAGEWNRVRLRIGPDLCEHEINGVKYFDYKLDSDDFRERIQKSKFRRMPLFAKSRRGYLALQGDHGEIAFREIRLRELGTERGTGVPEAENSEPKSAEKAEEKSSSDGEKD
jgi:hypothetical protein